MALQQPEPFIKTDSELPMEPPQPHVVDLATPRALIGLGTMTAAGTLAVLLPYLFSGVAEVAAGFVIASVLFAASAMTWHQLRKGRVEDQQETLLREAFHS